MFSSSWNAGTSASGMVGVPTHSIGEVGGFQRLSQVASRTIVSIHPKETIACRTGLTTALPGDTLHPLLRNTNQLAMHIGDLVFSRRTQQELLSMGVPHGIAKMYGEIDSDTSAFSVFNGKRMSKHDGGADVPMTQDDFRLLYGFRGLLESGPHEVCSDDTLVRATVDDMGTFPFMNVTGSRIEAGTKMTTFVNFEDIKPHPRMSSRVSAAFNRRDAEPLIVRGYFCPVPVEWHLAYENSLLYELFTEKAEAEPKTTPTASTSSAAAQSAVEVHVEGEGKAKSKLQQKAEALGITAKDDVFKDPAALRIMLEELAYHVRCADSMIVGTCTAAAETGSYGQITIVPR